MPTPMKECQCGAGCLFSKEGEPCWGEVTPVDHVVMDDGDDYWVHACEGHFASDMGMPYRAGPEPKR